MCSWLAAGHGVGLEDRDGPQVSDLIDILSSNAVITKNGEHTERLDLQQVSVFKHTFCFVLQILI